MFVVIGPHCFGCEGHNVVDRYFWGAVAWTAQGPMEGWVKRAVCLDCQGEVGSKYQPSDVKEQGDE